jgi:uncharacterized membrane protein YgaE (UPF0421/DUF939 family)
MPCNQALFPDTSSLISATLAVFSVALASVLVFEPTIRENVNPATAVLAPTWALVLTTVHVGTVFAEGTKSILGACLGAGLGAAAYALADLIPTQIQNQHILATLIVSPFAFLIVLGDPVVGAPLAGIIRSDVALLSMYIVCSFSNLKGYTYCVNAIVALSYGSVSAMFVVGVFRIFSQLGSTKRKLQDSLTQLRSAQTHWLEGLTAFMTSSSGDHMDELRNRQEAATDAVEKFQQTLNLARSSDPWSVLMYPEMCADISVRSVLMHSQLLAFSETITQESYSEDTMKTSYVPVAEAFNKTRMSTVLALRPTTREKVQLHAHLSLKDEAINLYNTLISNASNTAQNRSCQLPVGSQVVRMHSAVFSLIIFCLLVDHFLDDIQAATSLHGPWVSMRIYYRERWRKLWSRSEWKKCENFAYVYRAVIGQQIVAQIALFIARNDPERFGKYIAWSMLPILFTFLSTVGGSVIKGSKRVVGTLIGGGLGCITALTNADSPSSFFLEMMIVSFIANLFSYHPAVGYASTVGGFTWFILTLPSITEVDTDVLLTTVFYRLVLTVGGVSASLLISGLLFPSFSASEMRKSFSSTMAICTQLVIDGIRGVMIGVPFQEDGLNRMSATTSVESFKGAGGKALKSLQRYISRLHVLCVESRAEMGFIRKFCCMHDKRPSIKNLTDSENTLYRFIDTVLVLVATAATTRTSHHAHALFFSDAFMSALRAFTDKVELSGTKLAGIIHGDTCYDIDDCYVGPELEDVDRNLMAMRQMLGEAKKLHEAVLGGSPLIYVFVFALGQMADSWDNFVRALGGLPSTIRDDPDRLSRISSSISNLRIF